MPQATDDRREQRQQQALESKQRGYTGDCCWDCGSFTMIRNGTCLRCNNCGATSGCS